MDADLNNDGVVDSTDVALLASQWLQRSDDYVPVARASRSQKTFAAVQAAAISDRSRRVEFLDDFEDYKKWVAVVGTVQNGNVNSAFMDKSMKTTGGIHSSYPIIIYRDIPDCNFNSCTFRLRYYVESSAGLTRNSSSYWPIMFYFDAGTNLTKYAQVTYLPAEAGIWHDATWTSSELITVGGFNFATDKIKRIWIRCHGDTTAISDRPVIYFDRFKAFHNDNTGPARVIIGLDDGWTGPPDSQYDGLMYAASKGIRTYCALATDQVGINPKYMTWNQVSDLYATGMVNMHVHYSIPPYGQGEQAMRDYCVKAKQDLIIHGITESDAEVFVMPSGTDGMTGYIPSAEDVLVLRDYFDVVRGTGGFWTGAGNTKEGGSVRTRAYISKDRPQRWWTYALGIGTGINISDKIARAKAHGTILSVYAHLGVTHDMTLEEWKAVIDIIAAARDRGDVEVVSLLDI